MGTPHDALFKATFTDITLARDELARLLTAPVAAHFDFDTLEVCQGSLVDEELRASHTDLLYQLNTKEGKSAIVYVLFEHQSSHDPWMAFRLLEYMVRIWSQWRKDNPKSKKLPLVLPLVLYNGENRWTSSLEFGDLLDVGEALRPFVLRHQPRFEFLLDDLHLSTAMQIAARSLPPLAKLTLLGLWIHSWPRLELAMPAVNEVMQTLDGKSERTLSAVTTFLVYLTQIAPDDLEDRGIQAKLEAIQGPPGSENTMNHFADRLIEQGLQKGLHQGLEQGLHQGLERGLEQGRIEGETRGRIEGETRGRIEGETRGRIEGVRTGIAAALEARSIHLSELGRARLSNCSDIAALTSWLTRAVTANHEADVFGPEAER